MNLNSTHQKNNFDRMLALSLGFRGSFFVFAVSLSIVDQFVWGHFSEKSTASEEEQLKRSGRRPRRDWRIFRPKKYKLGSPKQATIEVIRPVTTRIGILSLPR